LSNFGHYTGKTFLEIELPPREWLIEGIIRKNDSVILVGNEKSGKSLFIFQLICSLTSAQPFLDKYEVKSPCKVAYFQLEGELADSQDRMKRMIKTLEFQQENLSIYFYPPIELGNKEYAQNLCKVIQQNGTPDILIIDPIYFAFSGSLNSDDVVREFIGNIRIMKDTLKCAVILVHHTHKQKWSTDGFKIDEGDEALFGSKFLKAWADHIIMFHYDSKKMIRTMSCVTQRSGDIIKECILKLIEPSPLYFEHIEKGSTKDSFIVNMLMDTKYKDGATSDMIMKKLDINKGTFYSSIKSLLFNETINKSPQRPTVYTYNHEKFKEKGVKNEKDDYEDEE
jgi:hypothetical protein